VRATDLGATCNRYVPCWVHTCRMPFGRSAEAAAPQPCCLQESKPSFDLYSDAASARILGSPSAMETRAEGIITDCQTLSDMDTHV
jgi:hypothetical protein